MRNEAALPPRPVSEAVADWLQRKHIRHVFGIVGGGNVTLWNEVSKVAEIVCCHHEQAAAQAAIYYYRTSKRLPLCLVTTGAGSANAITGVINAWMDSVPLLVISGNEPRRLWKDSDVRVLGTQGYRSADLVSPVCKFAVSVMSHNVLQYLEDAHRCCLSERQGPAWVDIPKDVQGEPCAG